jgi:hypothetical protein
VFTSRGDELIVGVNRAGQVEELSAGETSPLLLEVGIGREFVNFQTTQKNPESMKIMLNRAVVQGSSLHTQNLLTYFYLLLTS